MTVTPRGNTTFGNDFCAQLSAIGRVKSVGAFEDIYAFYAGRVKRFLLDKGLNEDSAENLMQQIMLLVWKQANTFDRSKLDASTWIYTIARDQWIYYCRGEARVEAELNDALFDYEKKHRTVHHEDHNKWQCRHAHTRSKRQRTGSHS